MNEQLYLEMGISRDVYEYAAGVLEGLTKRFEAIDRTAEYNQLKVLGAMQKNRISAEHFTGSTGYLWFFRIISCAYL